jgi:hypothetical protein
MSLEIAIIDFRGVLGFILLHATYYFNCIEYIKKAALDTHSCTQQIVPHGKNGKATN